MQKRIVLPEIGEVLLQKRKSNRSLRLTVGHDGTLRVSMPAWSPYAAGEAFARSKTEWIMKHQALKQQPLLSHGDRIGKAHRIEIIQETRTKPATRVTATRISVRLPQDLKPDSEEAQSLLRKAAVRALKQEATALLPGRLDGHARQYSFSYSDVNIKQLKSRWGSCNSQSEITLSCYLMQLPWELIDYVIMHELMHTRIMAHGPQFWTALSRHVSNLPVKRRAMREHRPALIPQI
jgi:predicted metal-dependent hydrolase